MLVDRNKIPKHIAFIMDGNGRWAQERGLPRIAGHRAGAIRVKEIVKTAGELGVEVVTFFTFSSENWNRPEKEVNMLMHFINVFLDKEIKNMIKKNVRFMRIGQDDPLPEYLRAKLKEAEEKTMNNTGLVMVLALNYGARREITEAVKKIVNSVIKGKFNIDNLDENILSQHLYTSGLPDPDFLIRTSGEMRLSNFLLWQLSYAELYFPKVYWPDFGREEFEKAIKVYHARERKFGSINMNKENG